MAFKEVNLAKIFATFYGSENTGKSMASRKVKGIRENGYVLSNVSAKEIVTSMSQKEGKAQKAAGAAIKNWGEFLESVPEVNQPTELTEEGISPFILKKFWKELETQITAGDITKAKEILQKIKKAAEEAANK
jgi:hypothetical protein